MHLQAVGAQSLMRLPQAVQFAPQLLPILCIKVCVINNALLCLSRPCVLAGKGSLCSRCCMAATGRLEQRVAPG